MISGCQHAFCLGCIVLKFEGKHSFECPHCLSSLVPFLVVPCKVRWSLVDSLMLKCRCGQKFPNRGELNGHKENCDADKQGHSLTVNDLLTLDLN